MDKGWRYCYAELYIPGEAFQSSFNKESGVAFSFGYNTALFNVTCTEDYIWVDPAGDRVTNAGFAKKAQFVGICSHDKPTEWCLVWLFLFNSASSMFEDDHKKSHKWKLCIRVHHGNTKIHLITRIKFVLRFYNSFSRNLMERVSTPSFFHSGRNWESILLKIIFGHTFL